MERKQLIYRYTVRDKSWELDWFDLTIDECAELTRVTGMRYPVLGLEHDAGDALAVKALLWMARRKAGEKDLDFNDPSMNFPMRDFMRRKVTDTEEPDADPQEPTAPEPAPARKTPRKKPTSSRK